MEQGEKRGTTRRMKSSKMWASLTGGGALGIVGVMLLLAPMASAAPVIMTAPYTTGNVVAFSSTLRQGAGANVAVITPPAAFTTTGLVREAFLVTAAANGMQPSLAREFAAVGLGGVLYTPSTTAQGSLVVSWTLSYSALLGVKQPTPITGLATAAVVVTARAYIIESTSGLVLAGSQVTATVLQKTIAAGNFIATQSTMPVLLASAPVQFLGGSHYLVYTTISVQLSAFAMGSGTSAPSASVSWSLGLSAPSALSFIQVG